MATRLALQNGPSSDRSVMANLIRRIGSVLLILAVLFSITTSIRGQQTLPTPEEMLRQLDSNGDGRLTMSDANDRNRQFLQTVFQTAGKANTESISLEELRVAIERHRRGNGRPASAAPRETEPAAAPGRALFAALDTNRDGRLSRSEWAKVAQQFESMDDNGDASLDLDELSTALSAPPSATPAESGRPSRLGSTTKERTSKDGSTPEPERKSTKSSSRRPAGGSSLNGRWRGWVVFGRGENPNNGHMELELDIEGNRIAARELGTNRSGGGLGDGTFEVAGTAGSGNLDAVGTTGRHAGQRFLGIYEVQGDTLRWCSGNNNRPRPRDFATDRGNYLMILHHQTQ